MVQLEYKEEYVERIFSLWYESGMVTSNEFVNSLPKDSDGKSPTKQTLISWISSKGWKERADALSAAISVVSDQAIIDKRKKMFEEQERVADELLKLGLDFLKSESGGIKNDATAIRAIDLGLSTKRAVTGVAEAYVKISKMSDEDIAKELKNLLGKPKQNEDSIIDAVVTDTESK